MSPSYRFEVRGRVQGVSFRQSTRDTALRLGLRGWVRNRDDGAVEGWVAGGDAATLAAFRAWLEQGPRLARVDQLLWQPATGEGGTSENADDEGFAVRV